MNITYTIHSDEKFVGVLVCGRVEGDGTERDRAKRQRSGEKEGIPCRHGGWTSRGHQHHHPDLIQASDLPQVPVPPHHFQTTSLSRAQH